MRKRPRQHENVARLEIRLASTRVAQAERRRAQPVNLKGRAQTPAPTSRRARALQGHRRVRRPGGDRPAVIIGEFGPGRNIGPSPTNITPQAIIQAAEARNLGWLAWAWDDNPSAGDDCSRSRSMATTTPAPISRLSASRSSRALATACSRSPSLRPHGDRLARFNPAPSGAKARIAPEEQALP